MEAALIALLNFSPVQVVAGENLPSGAYYDPRQMTLAIDTACPDSQAFAAIAASLPRPGFMTGAAILFTAGRAVNGLGHQGQVRVHESWLKK